MKKLKKIATILASFVFVLVGGIALASCGSSKDKKPDEWKNAETATWEEFCQYVTRDDVNTEFSTFTSTASASSMGYTQSQIMKAIKGSTERDFQASITSKAYYADQSMYIKDGMIYVSDMTGKYCFRPEEGVYEWFEFPFAVGGTFMEHFNELRTFQKEIHHEAGESDDGWHSGEWYEYVDYLLDFVNIQKIVNEENLSIKFRLETEWSETNDWEDGQTKVVYTFAFVDDQITSAEAAGTYKFKYGKQTYTVKQSYKTVASTFTSINFPSNLENREVWPEKDEYGSELEWEDVSIDDFFAYADDAETTFSSFLLLSVGETPYAFHGQFGSSESDFQAESLITDTENYVAIRNGKIYGENEEGEFSATISGSVYDYLKTPYLTESTVKAGINATLASIANSEEWTVESVEKCQSGMLTQFDISYKLDKIAEENKTYTVNFYFIFIDGKLYEVVASLGEYYQSPDSEWASYVSHTTLFDLARTEEFEFSFPSDMNSWTSISEQEFKSKFGF